MDTYTVANATWTVNGSAVVTSGDRRISISGSTLKFSSLTTFDSGVYTCTLGIAAPQLLYIAVQNPQESPTEMITALSKFFDA